ncbi:SCO family protein [Aporhodopirellula aestuarii]|uniref:SCO family protein n=1 Tax=Aporhodopirellula aestuarii TaxID=2950107 RepID=A0ABT0U1S8_9BACT|nr:SCO family protein [Aporhodopirellula aestuarii]MCM2370852.1 SCO family protein [Aporhodopirellula aestuarii]
MSALTPYRAPIHAGHLLIVGCVLVASMCGGMSVSAQPISGAAQDGSADVLLNDRMPREVRDVTVKQNLGDQVTRELPLINSQGEEVTLGDYLDGEHPLILTLNYSNCPMLCNVQLNQLAQSLEKGDLKIGEDFRCISISIDPTETNERLRETQARYVEQVPSHPNAQTGWAFCRTTQNVIDQLAKEVGFSYNYNEATGEYAHPAMLAFLTPEGVITRYSLGVAFPPDQMKLALVEAGQGEVGSYIDQFVMLCYTFDPAAGSYVPEAWKIMRLGGAITIGLLGIALLPYWLGRKGNPLRREKPNNSPEAAAPSADGTVPLKPTQWFGG